MKNGANFKDQNVIAAMAAEGATVDQISQHLRISTECISNFMPKAGGKGTGKGGGFTKGELRPKE